MFAISYMDMAGFIVEPFHTWSWIHFILDHGSISHLVMEPFHTWSWIRFTLDYGTISYLVMNPLDTRSWIRFIHGSIWYLAWIHFTLISTFTFESVSTTIYHGEKIPLNSNNTGIFEINTVCGGLRWIISRSPDSWDYECIQKRGFWQHQTIHLQP